MDEKLKYRREIIFKVLAWGTFVCFLVWGYSLTQSNLFELKAPKRQILVDLDNAKQRQANVLKSEAENLSNSGKTSEAAERWVKAAQIEADVHLAQEERWDSFSRAIGLIIGASIYCVFYPIVVWLAYKRTDPGAGPTEKDVIPLRVALIYAIVMSLGTFITAFLTAWR